MNVASKIQELADPLPWLETSLTCPLRINLLLCASTLIPNIETHVVCVKPVVNAVSPASNVLPVRIQIGMPPTPPRGNFLLEMHVV